MTIEAWEESCVKCEKTITVESMEHLCRLKTSLKFDRRKQGRLGLTLTNNIPELGLTKHMRLEPSWIQMDIGQVFKQNTVPVQFTFWTRALETKARHRNPLFDVAGGFAIGLTILSLAADILHTVHLGIMQQFVLAVFWRILEADTWEIQTGSREELTTVGVQMLMKEYFAWFGKRAKQFPEEKLTRVNAMRKSMLGEDESGPLKTKAAETFGLLLFSLDLLLEHKNKVKDADLLHACGSELVTVLNVMRREPFELSNKGYQDCR